jgi:hypothetical protein
MLIALRALWTFAFICAFPGSASADSWAAPQVKEVFSASRDHFVRVIPGNSLGDMVGFAGAARGAHATAEFYQRQRDRSYRLMQTVELLNPVAPAEFFVSNNGHLATIDNWHNRGYGSVIAVYDPKGNLLKAYALADLFSQVEIGAFPHSVSSAHWHRGPVYINQDQRTLYAMIESGRDLVIGLETGRFAYCETRGGSYLCRDSNTERRWVPYADAVPQR